MAIKMQGTWLVGVKSKNAAFPQEFIISGAASGNGTYAGTHVGEVVVTGSSWAISVRHNPGSGFKHSQLKIKFPTTSGGFHRFDIQSNDSGNDTDFDDLVLSCRTPVALGEHVIFGHVSDYQGPCIFNRCFPIWVIDTPIKLRDAWKIPSLRERLLEIDPNIIRRIPLPWPPDPIGPVSLNPQPLPPKAFTPIVVPFPGELATPLKQRFLVKTEEKTLDFGAGKKQATAPMASEKIVYQSVVSVEELKPAILTADIASLKKRSAIEAAIARFRFCDSDTLANVRVKFYEYDRTEAEKAGGPYTGEGNRTYLGSTYTDDFGNYVFHFTGNPADEVANDLAPGEDFAVAQAPDIIAEVMQPLDVTQPAFETAPYFNIPALRRINICVPRERLGIRPLVCDGQHIIQGIGNIALGAPTAMGRSGAGNTLTSIGIVSSTGAGGLAPVTDCAAWAGSLIMRGCLNNPNIKYYALEHRRAGGTWAPLDVRFSLPRFFGSLLFNSSVNLGIIGGRAVYLNVETDGNDWQMAYRNIKAIIPSTIFPESGPREIRITGLDASQNPVAGAQESVTLFILNNGVDLDILPEITLGAQTVSECGLFTLPSDGTVPTLRLTFKADQSNVPPVYGGYGFMGGYAVSINKGSGGFATTHASGPAKQRDAGPCDLSFTGTGGYVDLELSPATGNWLEANQTFCTFGIFLNGRLRRTDGQSAEADSSAVPVLFGIQR